MNEPVKPASRNRGKRVNRKKPVKEDFGLPREYRGDMGLWWLVEFLNDDKRNGGSLRPLKELIVDSLRLLEAGQRGWRERGMPEAPRTLREVLDSARMERTETDDEIAKLAQEVRARMDDFQFQDRRDIVLDRSGGKPRLSIREVSLFPWPREKFGDFTLYSAFLLAIENGNIEKIKGCDCGCGKHFVRFAGTKRFASEKCRVKAYQKTEKYLTYQREYERIDYWDLHHDSEPPPRKPKKQTEL